MYRIWCEFKPNAKRAAGGTSEGPKQASGAWVVTSGNGLGLEGVGTVFVFDGMVGVLSAKPRRVGTRVSPRKLLNEFLEQRRLARVVNRIAL